MLHIVFAALLLLMAGCGGSGMTTAMVEPPVVMPPVVAPPEEPTEKPVESPVEPPVVMPPVELPEETNTPEPIPPDAPTLVERLSFPLQAWSDPMAFSTQHYGIERVPEQDIAMAQHMPIYHDDSCHAETGACLPLFPTAPERRLFVGVDQGVEHIGNLPSTGERGDIEVRYGNLNDGAGRAMVQDYLVNGVVGNVARYATRPEVRLIGTSSAGEFDHLVAAVQIVNAALPLTQKCAWARHYRILACETLFALVAGLSVCADYDSFQGKNLTTPFTLSLCRMERSPTTLRGRHGTTLGKALESQILISNSIKARISMAKTGEPSCCLPMNSSTHSALTAMFPQTSIPSWTAPWATAMLLARVSRNPFLSSTQ